MRLPLMLLSAGLSCLVAGCQSPQPALPPGVQELRAVRTVAELEAQPLCSVDRRYTGSNYEALRLGMQSTRAEVNSGICLYAMAVDYCGARIHGVRISAAPPGMVKQIPAGPVMFGIFEAGATPPRKVQMYATYDRGFGGLQRNFNIYRGAFMPEKAGRFLAAAYSEKGDLLAAGLIDVPREPAQPWLTLQDAPPQKNTPEVRDFVIGGPALPHHADMEGDDGPKKIEDINAVRGRGTMKEPSSTDLFGPFLPAEPSKEFTAKVEGDVIHLRGAGRLDLPDEHVLVRVWINGSPFFPNSARGMEKRWESDVYKGGIDIRLKFDGNQAKRGDRIRLQFLYAPAGLHRVPPELREVMPDGAETPEPPDVVMSNTVELPAEALIP